MSRTARGLSYSPSRVPRASGDEPLLNLHAAVDFTCSPRERG